MEPHPLRPALWMLGGAASFALMGGFTHALGSRCDWLVVALTRAVFMFGSSALLAKAAGARLAVLRPPSLWVRSLAGSVSLVCNFYAMARLPVADALTLMSMYPLWIVAVSAVLLRRAPSAVEFVGMACGLLGVALIQRPHLGGDTLAVAAAVASSATTAVALMGLHRLRGVDTRAVVAHFAAVGSLVAAGWLGVRWASGSVPNVSLDPSTLGMLLGVAVVGTVGQFCLTRAYALGAPTRVAVVGLSQVAFAMILDVAIWGRSMTPLTLLGFGLVLAPTALLTGGARRKLAQATAPEPPSKPSHAPGPRPVPACAAAGE